MNKEKSLFFISVILPIEELENIELEKLIGIQQELDNNYWDYEIILVATQGVYKKKFSEINKLLERIPSIRFIQLSTKLSREAMLECGAENSIGDFVILFDLQSDPSCLIKEGIEKCSQGTDILIGTSNFDNSFFYTLGRKVVASVLRWSDYSLPKNASDFRVLSRRAVNATFSLGKQNQDFFMRIQNSGFEWKILPYNSTFKRKKSFYQGVKRTLDLMVFNSLNPLKAISILGLFGSLSAFIFSLYSLTLQVFKNNIVEGWTSTVLLISFFFLLQFLMLSFISQYLARLLRDLNRKSEYAVVFEKNSRVMVNRDRLNVLDDEKGFESNLVQTGRNR